MAYRVSKPLFGQLVQDAIDELPPQFAEFLEQVPIEVRQQPTAAQLDSVGLRGQGLLLGLYHGRPLTRRSVEDSGRMPDVIYIFRIRSSASATASANWSSRSAKPFSTKSATTSD